MSTETDRLEREAETRRASVDATIDALRDRLSVNSIVEEVTTMVRRGNGGDMARNFGRQVRDNPLALGLVGAGLAWLLAGPGVRDSAGNLRRGYDDWRYDRFAEAFPPDSEGRRDAWQPPRERGAGYPAGYGPGVGRDFASTREGGAVGYTGPATGRPAGDDGPGLTDRARGAASSAASSVGGAMSSAADSVSGVARSAYDSANRTGHDITDAAWRAEEAAMRGVRGAGDSLAYAGRRARRTFLDALAEEPLVVGAVALAIGAAVGAALPPTRREDALFGETRDRLRDEAYSYGEDAVRRAGTVAEKSYEAASGEAERQGLKPTGESGTLAEKVGSVARAAVDTARTEARNEVSGASSSGGPDMPRSGTTTGA